MKKYLILCLAVLFPVLLSTGCNSGNEDKKQENQTSEVTRYRNGTVMIQDKSQSSDPQGSFDPGTAVNNVEVGPGQVKFGPEENY
jgi:hypothetical protein